MDKFEWKLRDAERQKVEDKTYSGIYIGLTTKPSEQEPNRDAYEWGEGWDCDESRRSWENDVHGRLEEAGYKLQQNDIEQGYYVATSRDEADKTRLYINPSEITGYVKEEKKAELLNILENSPEIQEVEVRRDVPVCEMSDAEYKRILDRNAKEIFKDIKETHERHGLNPERVAAAWVAENRIPRLGDTMGVMKSDIDTQKVEAIAEQYAKKGKFVQKEDLGKG